MEKKDFVFNQIIEKLKIMDYKQLQVVLEFVSSISSPEYDLLININKSIHHDIIGSVSRQFKFKNSVNLTEGSLNLQMMFRIPELVTRLPKNYNNVAVVLTGHPLMQLLATATAVAQYTKVDALLFDVNTKSYFVRKLQKFEKLQVEPEEQEVEVVFPVEPFGNIKKLLDREGIKYTVVCSKINNPSEFDECVRKTVSILLGSKATLGIDCPGGLPAVIGTLIIEGYMVPLGTITAVDGKLTSILLSHERLREGRI